jgi:hypothetical protein
VQPIFRFLTELPETELSSTHCTPQPALDQAWPSPIIVSFYLAHGSAANYTDKKILINSTCVVSLEDLY